MNAIEQIERGMKELHEDGPRRIIVNIGDDIASLVCEASSETFWRKWLSRNGATVNSPDRTQAETRFIRDIGAVFGERDEDYGGCD